MPNRRKPATQKQLTGRTTTKNTAGRAIPAPIMTFDAALKPPAPPRGLHETGREIWSEMWTAGAAWLAPQTDRYIIKRICRLHEIVDALYERLESDDELMVDNKAHPLLLRVERTESELTRLESLCGFNPVARGQLGYAEVRRVSKIDELMDRRAARGA